MCIVQFSQSRLLAAKVPLTFMSTSTTWTTGETRPSKQLSIINPRHACARVTVVVLCVLCVSVSVFSILPSRAFRRPMRGISGYSVKNAVKLRKAVFSKTA